MLSLGVIPLTAVQAGALIAFCGLAVWRGHPEWLLGIYLALAGLPGVFVFRGIAHIWPLLGAIVGASVVLVLRNRKSLTELLPTAGRGIIFWMVAWWIWMVILIGLFRPSDTKSILTSLLLYLVAPLPVVLLIAKDQNRIKRFAVSYCLGTVISAVTVLAYLSFRHRLTLAFLATDPFLRRLSVDRLGLVGRGYHWFAYSLGHALLFSIALLLSARSGVRRVVSFAGALGFLYMLIMSADRQAIGSVALAVPLLVWRVPRSETKSIIPKILDALLAVAGLFVAVMILQALPDLMLRRGLRTLTQAFNVFDTTRPDIWTSGLRAFGSSPIWGTGFTEYNFHNIFISTLAEQGIVGFVYLSGFILFAGKRIAALMRLNGENNEVGTWTAVFTSIFVFGLVHQQFSGSAFSAFDLHWSAAFLWCLSDLSDVDSGSSPGSGPRPAGSAELQSG